MTRGLRIMGNQQPSTCVGEGGAGTCPLPFDELFTDPRHIRSDLQLLQKAIRHGWAVLPASRGYLTAKVCELLNDPRARVRMAAVRTLAAMGGVADASGRSDAGAELARQRWGT